MSKYAFWIAVSFVTSITSVFAGGVSGGGGDLPAPGTGSAWFLGSGSVHYCVSIAPDFGIDETLARAQIASALEKWTKYIDAKQVNSHRDARYHLSTRFEFKPACNGTED